MSGTSDFFDMLGVKASIDIKTYEKDIKAKDKEIEILNNIIKEVREYIERNKQKIISAYGDNFDDDFDIALDEEDIDNILEILDKGE